MKTVSLAARNFWLGTVDELPASSSLLLPSRCGFCWWAPAELEQQPRCRCRNIPYKNRFFFLKKKEDKSSASLQPHAFKSYKVYSLFTGIKIKEEVHSQIGKKNICRVYYYFAVYYWQISKMTTSKVFAKRNFSLVPLACSNVPCWC